MRVLITGGAGFIGSHLCDLFLARGHEAGSPRSQGLRGVPHEVVAMDNLVTGLARNIQHLWNREDFSFIRHDVTQFIQVDGELDAILHFASPASPDDYLRLPIPTLKAGSLGTHNALGLARVKGARFLLASTSEVYGDPEVHPQPEDYWGHVNPVGPRGVYDEAKRFAEAMTMSYHRVHGIQTHIARIFNTYGPRMRLNDGRVIPNFIAQALAGVPLTVYGDGSQTRSFCYISDLGEGIYRLLHSDEAEPVNLGNPEEMGILELAHLVNRIAGNGAGIVFQDRRTPGDPQVRCPDIAKARRILGWEPRVGLEEGLALTIQWFREQGSGRSR